MRQPVEKRRNIEAAPSFSNAWCGRPESKNENILLFFQNLFSRDTLIPTLSNAKKAFRREESSLGTGWG
jgi:hypothetical protein